MKPRMSAVQPARTKLMAAGAVLCVGSTETAATIGDRTAAGGTVKITSGADHKEETSAVSGTDPMETDGKAAKNAKDIAIDAAA